MVQSQAWFLLIVTLLVVGLLFILSPILWPFALGMGIAYVADPFADRIEAKGYSRTLAVVAVFLLMFVIVLASLLLVLPVLAQQLQALIALIPEIQTWVNTTLLPYLESHFDVDTSSLELDLIAKTVSSEWQQTGNIVKQIAKYLTSSTVGLIGFLGSAALVPVVTFYLLRDFDVLMANIRDILPRNIEPKVSLWARECDEVLGAFARGQMMVMFALGIIYSAGLAIVGLEYAVVIGIVAGLASVVPYLGFAIGFVSALLVALFQFDSYWGIALVTLVFCVGQVIESTVLTPLLVGDRIGLHPVAVIFALLAGAQLFGFAGMLLALPAAAVIMVLLRSLHRSYRKSKLYEQ